MPLDENFFDVLLPKENEVLYDSPPPRISSAALRRSYALARKCGRKIRHILERSHGGRKQRAIELRSLIQMLLSDINPALEIGPFSKPFLDRSTAKFFDVCAQDELNQRARTLDMYQDGAVPFIDYVSPHGDLSIVDEKFNLVFSSHVLEHQVDLISHLQQVYRILQGNGAYILAVPDYRYCFDHYKSETILPDVLEAYYTKRRTHTLRDLLSAVLYNTHNDPTSHWLHEHGNCHDTPTKANLQSLEAHFEMWRNKEESSGYLDVHAWRFRPEGFRSIVKFLREVGLISFDILRIYETNYDSSEFFVALIKRTP